MNIVEDIKNLAELIVKHQDFLSWLDVEFYAGFVGILVAAFIGYMAVKKFLLNKHVPKIGKVISGIALCVAVLVGCVMTYNILTYSAKKLSGCKALIEQQQKLVNEKLKNTRSSNPELDKLLSELDTLIKQCIELEKK